MTETPLRSDVDARGIATLTLARPEKHNALSSALISALHESAEALGRDASVRAVVLGAEGQSFCAGGDLRWMEAQMNADAETRRREARKIAHMLEALASLPKPLIARVHGNAFGGGVGLCCVCDVTIGVTTAKFGLTETRLGLIPATIGPHVVARMGGAMARRVFMSSRVFGAKEAAELGILSRAVVPAELDAAIEAEILPYLNCAPGAVAEAKALVRRLDGTVDPATIDETIDALVRRWDGEEAREGITAFFDKRPPGWAAKG